MYNSLHTSSSLRGSTASLNISRRHGSSNGGDEEEE